MKKDKQKKSAKQYLVGLILVGLISVIALIISLNLTKVLETINQGPNSMLDDEYSWECIQSVCAVYLSEAEIAEQVCFNSEQGVVCSISVDGNQSIVPKDQLDFSSLRLCKEEVCVKEVKVRSVNYTIN